MDDGGEQVKQHLRGRVVASLRTTKEEADAACIPSSNASR